jgi:hypothetical protein
MNSAVPETLEKILRQRRDTYEKYLVMQDLHRRLRQQELNAEIIEDELKKHGKPPLDYSQYSTEDDEVSDYEIQSDDLYPSRKNQK